MTTAKRKILNRGNIGLIEVISEDLLTLANLIIQKFEFAIVNADSSDAEIKNPQNDFDDHINSLECYIHEKSTLYLTENLPSAFESNVMLKSLTIFNDLSHINALINAIAYRAQSFISQSSTHRNWKIPHIAGCADLIVAILSKVVSALSFSDNYSANQAIYFYSKVAEEYDFLAEKMLDKMVNEPHSITTGLDVLYIAKAIEGIANNARYISLQVLDIVAESKKQNRLEVESSA